jgi:hypothetical protein
LALYGKTSSPNNMATSQYTSIYILNIILYWY